MLHWLLSDLPAFAMRPPLAGLFTWLFTYLIHSTLLLGGVWVGMQLIPRFQTPEAEDVLWKVAVVGAIFTASLATSPLSLDRLEAMDLDIPPAPPAPVAPVAPPAPLSNTPLEAPGPAPVVPTHPSLEAQPSTASQSVSGEPPAPSVSTSTVQEAAWDATPFGWLLVGLWGTGALVLLLRRFGARARFFRFIGPRTPVDDSRVQALAEDVGRRLNAPAWLRRRLHVTTAPDLTNPLACGWREICLPEAALDLPDARLRSILAHEWAHLLRRDPLWMVGLAVLESGLFLQPLNRLARRRLQAAAEHRCDALVVTHTGAAHALAGALLDAAEWTFPRPTPVPAGVTGMAGTRASVTERVERLLDGSGAASSWTLPRRLAAVAGVAMLAAVALPALSVPTAPSATAQTAPPSPSPAAAVPNTASPHSTARPPAPAPPPPGSTERAVPSPPPPPADTGRTRSTISTDDYSLDVVREGDVRLEGDGSGVAYISLGGHITVREQTDDTVHEVTFRPNDDPTDLSVTYRVDGQETAVDADAQQRIQSLLLAAMRRAGIGAEARAAYLMERGGVDALRSELDAAEDGPLSGTFMAALLTVDGLSDADAASLLNDAGARIDSDYGTRRLLQALAVKRDVLGDALFDAYLAQVNTLDSDFERRSVLRTLLGEGGLTAGQQTRVLQAVQGMDSDFEKRALLETLAEQVTLNADGLSVLRQILRGIDSDFELRTAIATLHARSELTPSQRAGILREGLQIDSDYEMRTLLQTAMQGDVSDPVFAAAVDLVRSIDSDFEMRTALDGMLQTDGRTAAELATLLEVAGGIDSDAELGRLLRKHAALADHESAEVRAAFEEAFGSIDSSYERERVYNRVNGS